MKKYLLFIVFVMVSVLFITGCGKNDLSKYAGTYKLEYSKYVGDPDSAKTTEEWTIVLEKDGTGKSNRDGGSYNVEWSINNEDITVTEKFGTLTNEFNGTLKEGRLDIFNGDKTKEITLEAVFNKQ